MDYNISVIIFVTLNGIKVRLDLLSEVGAGRDDFLDNTSVSLVLALRDTKFLLLLGDQNSLVDQTLFFTNTLLHKLLRIIKHLNQGFFISQQLKLLIKLLIVIRGIVAHVLNFLLEGGLLFESELFKSIIELLSLITDKLDEFNRLRLHVLNNQCALLLELLK